MILDQVLCLEAREFVLVGKETQIQFLRNKVINKQDKGGMTYHSDHTVGDQKPHTIIPNGNIYQNF